MAKDKITVKKQNKEPSKFKIGLVNFIRALFSNNAAIEGANSSPWWIAIIFILLAAILPVIPITVSAANVNGSDYIGTNTNGLETKLTIATKELKDDGFEFIVNGEKNLLMFNGELDISDTKKDLAKNEEYLVYQHIGETNKQIEFEIYYANELRTTVQNMLVGLSSDSHTYIRGTTTLKGEADPEDTKYYIPSFLILSKEGLYLYNYQPDSVTLTGKVSFKSDWDSFKENDKLLEKALVVKEGVLPGTMEYLKNVYANWAGYIDASYQSAKVRNVWMNSGIYLGIYVVLILFMGLMVFLLTRGKKNNFNYLKYMDCQKIVAWASISPAILGMILGFLLASYAVMFFIILIGLRTMWLSMRQLKPY